ncbi:MAG TPA: proteasome activator [Nocardioides sp.]|nr:proteasome activator [Nocardioides sp.]
MQTAIYAQQVAARAQLEQMRQLPPGASAPQPMRPGDTEPAGRVDRGGMYL